MIGLETADPSQAPVVDAAVRALLVAWRVGRDHKDGPQLVGVVSDLAKQGARVICESDVEDESVVQPRLVWSDGRRRVTLVEEIVRVQRNPRRRSR